ncbi:hypothetical protein NSQ54_02770 [Alkalihalobacillus sp. FSL W8-0930]
MKKVLLTSSLLVVAILALQTDVTQFNLASFETLSGPYLPPVAKPI